MGMKKILLLEDEETLAGFYMRALEKAGHVVEWAASGEELLEVLSQGDDFDIFVLDHGLKNEERSGLDFLPEIRQQFPSAHLIFLSNYAEDHLKPQALDKGADAYFVKLDFSPSDLVAYIGSST